MDKGNRNEQPHAAEGRFQARTEIGQNFLVDRNILRNIVQEAGVSPNDAILEIGPGKGILTEELLKEGCVRLDAVELDHRLESFLAPLAARYPAFCLHWGDAVRFPFDALPVTPTKVVANIPYHITTPLIWAFFERLAGRGLRTLILMVQLEAAERLLAAPRTKERNPLGVTVDAMGTARIVRRVPPEAFRPVPQVESAVLRIELETNLHLPNDRTWRILLRQAFSQRRKMLRNTLKPVYGADGFIEETLQRLELPATSRAEELTTSKWLDFAALVRKEKGDGV